MKKILLFLPAMVFIMATASSQTKRIAHRSHSGSDASFTMDGVDNFGLDPRTQSMRDSVRNAKKAKEDSIRIANYRDSMKTKQFITAPKKKKKK